MTGSEFIKASKWVEQGKIGENIVCFLLNVSEEEKSSHKDLVDIMVSGRDLFVEVKTVHKWIDCYNEKSYRRRSRIWIKPEQHRFLLENDGFYAVVLLNEEDNVVEWSGLIKAKEINGEIDKRKAIHPREFGL